MKIFYNFFIFLFSYLGNLTYSMNFNFKLKEISVRCISEYLSQSTLGIIKSKYLVVYTINSDIKDIRVRLFDPKGNAIINKVYHYLNFRKTRNPLKFPIQVHHQEFFNYVLITTELQKQI